jgi:hypothetical protein
MEWNDGPRHTQKVVTGDVPAASPSLEAWRASFRLMTLRLFEILWNPTRDVVAASIEPSGSPGDCAQRGPRHPFR